MLLYFRRFQNLARVTLGVLSLAAVLQAPRVLAESAAQPKVLVQDARVLSGTLPNGVAYAILSNAEPKGRASLRLLVKAGAFNEQEEQRGLAHFLEHMAFNGSQHYAPGSLVEFFQRMGMSFGRDTNASTGFDRTQYQLELADAASANLKEGLKVLSDYAGGLLLLQDEIDKERGIIASEKLSRDSVESRTYQAALRFSYPGMSLADRMPIGVDEVIKKAPRERFLDFYNTWYRPENLVVVMVGDFDSSVAEALLKDAFGAQQARAPKRDKPSLGTLALGSELTVGVHNEAEATGLTISLSASAPAVVEADSAEKRLKEVPNRIAFGILSRRLGLLAKKENAAILGGSAGFGDSFDLLHEASVNVSCKAENWDAALAVAEQELRRALTYGFQEEEVLEEVDNILNALRRAVVSAPTRRSPALADSLLDAAFDREIFTTPEANLALYEPVLKTLTAEQCLQAFRSEWAKNNRSLFVSGRLPMPAGEAQALLTAAYKASSVAKVLPLEKKAALVWDYVDFGKPGVVAERRHVEDLDIVEVRFANGVRLNLKKTGYEAGRIRLLARVGEGAKTEPASLPGLATMASNIFDLGGLGRLSVDDLRRVLAGRNVSWRFGVDSPAFVFAGHTSPEDLLLQCQLLAAQLTDPGFRPESLRLFRKGIEQTYKRFAHSPEGAFSLEIGNLVANGDPRFGMPEQSKMMALELKDMKAWLSPAFAQGEIELSMVGDLDIEAAIKAVGLTLGALPERQKANIPAEMLKVSFPEKPFSRIYRFSSELPKSIVAIYWPTTDGIDTPAARRLTLLSSVLSDRLRVKIREEMGGTYSPSAGSVASETYPGYGYFVAQIEVSADMAEKVAAAVIAQADDLARNGLNADELERARKPLMTSLRQSARTNDYWLGTVLARVQTNPVALTWARTREADFAGISKAELDALAAKYLGAERASKAFVLSSGKSGQ